MSAVDKITALINLIDKLKTNEDIKTKDDVKSNDDDYSFPKSQGYCPEQSTARAKMRFKNKVVIITGSVGNFGKTCAFRMASEGCNVALWDKIDSTSICKEILSKYQTIKCKSYTVDVTNENTVKNTTDLVVNDFGSVDYLFNNDGYQGLFAPTHLYDINDFLKVINVNVIGAFIVLKYVSLAMMKNNSNSNGSIVNTASRAAIGAQPNMIAYGASKSAIFHMTRIAAKDLSPYNIRVNSISPGLVGPGSMWKRQIESQSSTNTVYYNNDTKKTAKTMINSTPLNRYGSVDEVIGSVTFLLSDDASYLTGVDIAITGGMN